MRYRIIKESRYNEETGAYIAYGIEIPTASFRDLCVNQSKIAEFALVCTEFKLSPIHLADAVHDFITELSMEIENE